MIELELDDPRWPAFVASFPEAGPFHHPAWSRLLADCYGFRPLALLTDEGDAGLPALELHRSRLVSLPFTDACAPLARSDEARRRLAGALSRHADVEVRAPLEHDGLATRVRGVSHELELDGGLEMVKRGFRAQMRRNIARAERAGVEVRRADERSDLVDTYYSLHVRTRRRQGVPVQPRRFFRFLWDGLIAQGLGTVLLAYAETTPVAGAVFLHWNGATTYKFGASDPEHWALRPNNLLFWEAIGDACARGDRLFDFGRTDLENQGLREFKSGWGARELPLVYTYVGGAPASDTSSLALRALAVAIRRSPSWVCRAVGEAGYRFAA